jgi:hypothetical protein
MPQARQRRYSQRPATRATSLRSRWNRAFALLTAIVLLSGFAGFLGTRLLVDTFHGAAIRVEREATVGARLRAEVVAQSLLVASTVDPAAPEVVEGDAKVRASFAEAIAAESDAPAHRLLERSRTEWQTLMAGVRLQQQPTRRPDLGAGAQGPHAA